MDLEGSRVQSQVVLYVVHGHVPFIKAGTSALQFLDEMDVVVCGQRDPVGRDEITEAFFQGVANIPLSGPWGGSARERFDKPPNPAAAVNSSPTYLRHADGGSRG